MVQDGVSPRKGKHDRVAPQGQLCRIAGYGAAAGDATRAGCDRAGS